jgi:phosphate transport system substrate-binding protein
MRLLLIMALAAVAAPRVHSAGDAGLVDLRLPHYVPAAVAIPGAATYLSGGGAVNIIGYNDMQDMIVALNRIYVQSHPDFCFALSLRGTRTGPTALTSGVTAFAPMGAEFGPAALAAYRLEVGAEPLLIRVAHDSLNPQALSAPLGIFVHRNNPLASIVIGDVAKAFTSRKGGDAITLWGQLGLAGEWARRPIRLCGMGPDYALGAFIQGHHFGGAPFAFAMEGFAQSAAVVKCVADDPLAIGFAAINRGGAAVKALAVARSTSTPAVSATRAALMAGEYPLDRYLYIAVRKLPGKALDPVVREYLRLVLSFEGQQAIAAGPLGYLPLNADEVAQERARLE